MVDIRFDAYLPAIDNILLAGAKEQIVIEVLAQQDAHHVRGIALTPTQGLARGMDVKDTGQPLQTPVGKGEVSEPIELINAAAPSQTFQR